jgi:hypothetical protein
MKFAKWVFLIGSIWGFVVLTPMLFLAERVGIDTPPPITHAEFYYGFVAAALVFQVLFFLISRDPVRYRPIMLIAVLEKFSFGAVVFTLVATANLRGAIVFFSAADLLLGVLYLVSYFRCGADGATARA